MDLHMCCVFKYGHQREIETSIYQQINGSNIGPKLLGHLMEGRGGRVIGFAVKWVPGARAAGPGDLEGCKKTLGRLHGLGIKHGDINKHNFPCTGWA